MYVCTYACIYTSCTQKKRALITDAHTHACEYPCRQREIIIRKINWDVVFGYMESQQMPARTSTARLLTALCNENEGAKAEVSVVCPVSES